MFSTAPPPAIAAAALAAVEFMLTPAGENRRQVLRRNLAHFASEMPMLFSGEKKLQSAIIPIIIGTAEAAMESSRVLADRGFFVPAIRFPTVARDAARLRVTISAKHTPRQITGLCAELRNFLSMSPEGP